MGIKGTKAILIQKYLQIHSYVHKEGNSRTIVTAEGICSTDERVLISIQRCDAFSTHFEQRCYCYDRLEAHLLIVR